MLRDSFACQQSKEHLADVQTLKTLSNTKVSKALRICSLVVSKVILRLQQDNQNFKYPTRDNTCNQQNHLNLWRSYFQKYRRSKTPS